MKKLLQISSIVLPLLLPLFAQDLGHWAAQHQSYAGGIVALSMLLNALAPALKESK